MTLMLGAAIDWHFSHHWIHMVISSSLARFVNRIHVSRLVCSASHVCLIVPQMLKTQFADVSLTQNDSIWIFLLCASMVIIGITVGMIAVFCCNCGSVRTKAGEAQARGESQQQKR